MQLGLSDAESLKEITFQVCRRPCKSKSREKRTSADARL
jgi:hypothetical protein